MGIPTRTLADLTAIKRLPINVISDDTDTNPWFYLVDANGMTQSLTMNLAAMLRSSDGKLSLTNAVQTNSIGQDQLVDSMRPVFLGAPALNGSGGTKIVNAQNITTNKTTTYTLAADVDLPRNVEVAVVDTTPSITTGVVTVTGLGLDGNVISETFNIAAGAGTYVGTKIFATVTAVTNGAVSTLGGSGDETISVYRGKVIGVGLTVKYAFPAAAVTNQYITSTNFLNSHTYSTFAHQPDVPRNVTITVTDTGASIVAGTITVTGTNQFGAVVTEVFDLAGPTLTFTGAVLFATLTSVVTASVTVLDGSGDETFVMGSGSVVLADCGSLNLGGAKVSVSNSVVAIGDFTTAGVDASAATYNGTKQLIAYIRPLG